MVAAWWFGLPIQKRESTLPETNSKFAPENKGSSSSPINSQVRTVSFMEGTIQGLLYVMSCHVPKTGGAENPPII